MRKKNWNASSGLSNCVFFFIKTRNNLAKWYGRFNQQKRLIAGFYYSRSIFIRNLELNYDRNIGDGQNYWLKTKKKIFPKKKLKKCIKSNLSHTYELKHDSNKWTIITDFSKEWLKVNNCFIVILIGNFLICSEKIRMNRW